MATFYSDKIESMFENVKDYESDLSSMILIANQMAYVLVKLDNFTGILSKTYIQ